MESKFFCVNLSWSDKINQFRFLQSTIFCIHGTEKQEKSLIVNYILLCINIHDTDH